MGNDCVVNFISKPSLLCLPSICAFGYLHCCSSSVRCIRSTRECGSLPGYSSNVSRKHTTQPGYGTRNCIVLSSATRNRSEMFGTRINRRHGDGREFSAQNCRETPKHSEKSRTTTTRNLMSDSQESKSGGDNGSQYSNESKNRKSGQKKYDGDPMAGPKIMPRPAPESYNGTGTAILWFRNDLRLSDNAALALANTAEYVVPVYVFDKRRYGMENASPHGFQRTGPFQADFIRQSVRDLRNRLRWKVSELVYRVGHTEDALADIAQCLVENELGPVRVVTHKEVTREETDMEKRVANVLLEVSEDFELSEKIPLHFVWGATLIHLDDLGFNPAGPALPSTFTEFRKLVEADPGFKVREEVPTPGKMCNFPMELKIPSDQLPSLRNDLQVEGLTPPHDYPFPHPLAVITYKGGEEAGLDRVNQWIWVRNYLCTYFQSRNESGSMDFSSKFSAWLAVGCLSPRTIYWNCKRYEEKVEKNKSTYWMIFELLTRDYFRWVAARAGDKLFALNGFTGKGASERSIWRIPADAITDTHKQRFKAWIEGKTGAPFVDASMREIAATGFMSNRGRQNAASFLIHDLEYPDWRAGAEYFESVLVDHDVASNWGNWAYLAGVGSDPRGGRRFNVIKQAAQYDPTGWFTKRWCDELWLLPPPLIHEPHTLSDEDLKNLEIEPGETYPRPIVTLPPARKTNLAAPPPRDPSEGEEEVDRFLREEMRPEDENFSEEDLKRMSREITWFAAPPGDPAYAATQTPEEIAAREEAKLYE